MQNARLSAGIINSQIEAKMTRASTSLSVERETAQYIKNRLAQEGIEIATKVRKKAVEITTVDAHPKVQHRVDVVAKEHQTSRSYIQADF